MNRTASFLLALLAAVAALALPASSQSIPGMIAKRETDLLSYEDKLAAYDAEQGALAQTGIVLGHNWKGPNGAYGTIIVGSFVPNISGFAQCRRFIHIVHHANDGGANPTFQGVICRDSGGQWMAQ